MSMNDGGKSVVSCVILPLYKSKNKKTLLPSQTLFSLRPTGGVLIREILRTETRIQGAMITNTRLFVYSGINRRSPMPKIR